KAAHLVRARQVQLEAAHEVRVHLVVHRREDVRPRVVQGVVEVEDPHPPRRRDPEDPHYFERMTVPTPSSVSTSSSSACGTRPSMMWQDRPPAGAAFQTQAVFGSLPAENT